jgi:insertion element IS1 protein InsB
MKAKIRCSKCKGKEVVKAGFAGEKQRYKCKKCCSYFVPKGSKKIHGQDYGGRGKTEVVIELYLEGMSTRGIGRFVKISHTTVIRWVRKESKKKKIPLPKYARSIEIDELYLYIKSKKRKKWLWIALCSDSRRILGFQIGGRGKATLKRLYYKIEPIQCERYYTDDHAPYKNVLPKEKHRTQKGKTNTIEGINSAIRHYLARFRRRSKCYSKSETMVEASMILLMNKYHEQYLIKQAA